MLRLTSLAAGFVAAGLLMAQPAPNAGATARKALDLLLAEKYADLEEMFAPNLKESLKLDALQKEGAQVKSFGAPENIGDPQVQVAGSNSVVTIPVKFASQNINLRMGINGSGQLSGFFMLPGGVAWQRPDYSKAGAFQERNVTIGEAPYKLPGALTIPTGQGPFPAVVLVHGTGPNDRDETVGAIKVFRDLAEGLASRGIVVLRYEKRSKLYLARMSAKPYTADDETVDDANAALTVLRAQPEVDGKRVYLLGHSLGGYLGARIAEQDGKVAGLIILAANERPLEDVIVEQASGLDLPAGDLANIKTAAARVKKLEPADEDQPNVLGLPVAYWVDLKGYDPVAVAKKLAIPVLVLQGERDAQVSMKDLAAWKAGVGGIKGSSAKSYPALNHLFVAGVGKSTEAEYRKPGHVAPEVVDDVAKFMGK
jgi:alpha-beta hydrolase superfamily lysophospholipase